MGVEDNELKKHGGVAGPILHNDRYAIGIMESVHMGMPGITEDQRIMVVALLANAIRKDAHLRERAHAVRRFDDPVSGAMAIRRAAPSQRYIDGMCDLVRVLFVNGGAVLEQCLEEAYVQAMGVPPVPGSGNVPKV